MEFIFRQKFIKILLLDYLRTPEPDLLAINQSQYSSMSDSSHNKRSINVSGISVEGLISVFYANWNAFFGLT